MFGGRKRGGVSEREEWARRILTSIHMSNRRVDLRTRWMRGDDHRNVTMMGAVRVRSTAREPTDDKSMTDTNYLTDA